MCYARSKILRTSYTNTIKKNKPPRRVKGKIKRRKKILNFFNSDDSSSSYDSNLDHEPGETDFPDLKKNKNSRSN